MIKPILFKENNASEIGLQLDGMANALDRLLQMTHDFLNLPL
jgi:hypothetical protein